MIFANYPGHFVAALLLIISAGLTLVTFHTGELRKAKMQAYRLPLILLQYVSIAIMLFILWDPSRPEESETLAKNSVLALFDTSQSMSVVEDGQPNRLDKALNLFQKGFRPFDVKSPDYKIYGFDRETYHSGSSDFLRRWGSQSNLNSVLTTLSQYDIGDKTDPPEKDAGETPATHKGGTPSPRGNVIGAVVFTDGQADDKNVDAYLPLRNSDFRIVFVGVGSRNRQPDVSIISLDAPSRMAVDSVCKVKVAVGARGLKNQPVTVELLKDGYVVDSREIPAGAFTRSNKGGSLIPIDVRGEGVPPLRREAVLASLFQKTRAGRPRDARAIPMDVYRDRHARAIPMDIGTRHERQSGFRLKPDQKRGCHPLDGMTVVGCGGK